ncbi:MAG TPA: DUF5076 domain-containing protein [Xanthobacteraceae bacterium]|jgi:hypothetical protein|nr:DUF5076 domain-containing protein [Xanthobacteraceae bacterium]
MSKNPYMELSIPPAAAETGGVEVLRAAIVDQSMATSIRRATDDPAAWGLLLGVIARQVAQIYAKESDMTEAAALERIRTMFEAEISSSNDVGDVAPVS